MRKLTRQRKSSAIAVLVVAVSIVASSVCGASVVTYDLNPGTMGLEVGATGRIWVSQYNADCVMGFERSSDLTNQNVLVVPRCENPRAVNLGPLGTKGYTASWDRYNDGNVVVFDVATGEIDAVLTEGPSDDCHFNVGLAPDESWLYFANYYGGSVTKLSLPGGAHVATIPVGSWPAEVRSTPDGTYLYANYGHASGAGTGLRVIDTAMDAAVFDTTLSYATHDMEFSPDGNRLYMTAPGSPPGPGGTPYVLVLNTSDPPHPTEIDVVDVGSVPYTIAVCDSVAAVSLLDGRICFINIRCDDNTVIGYEQVAGPAGTEPTIGYGDIHDGKAYFAAYAGSAVYIVDLPPCGVVVPYVETFDPDPEWATNNASRFYVDGGVLYGTGVTDSYEYCTTPLSSHPESFVLEWDSYLESSDWSSGLAFGLYGCERWLVPETNQALFAHYGHHDGGYFFSLHACDATGYEPPRDLVEIDLRGFWVHNMLSYDGAGTARFFVSEDGTVLGSAEISGLAGFDEGLRQLGMSIVHDCAVSGQSTSVRVDNVSFTGWAWTSVQDDEWVLSGPVSQNYPNPFNPETEIAFMLPVSGDATVSVHDAAGRLVRVLVDAELEAGTHRVVWDGTDADGRSVASGVYFYSVRAPQVEERRKMVMVK
jgi:DNA-binding beta-propeller fold protein YncE